MASISPGVFSSITAIHALLVLFAADLLSV
jgi:hypothetical protein